MYTCNLLVGALNNSGTKYMFRRVVTHGVQELGEWRYGLRWGRDISLYKHLYILVLTLENVLPIQKTKLKNKD